MTGVVALAGVSRSMTAKVLSRISAITRRSSRGSKRRGRWRAGARGRRWEAIGLLSRWGMLRWRWSSRVARSEQRAAARGSKMGIFLGICYQAESVRGKEFADVSTEVEKCIHTTADG